MRDLAKPSENALPEVLDYNYRSIIVPLCLVTEVVITSPPVNKSGTPVLVK